jgi:hypothetical protein
VPLALPAGWHIQGRDAIRGRRMLVLRGIGPSRAIDPLGQTCAPTTYEVGVFDLTTSKLRAVGWTSSRCVPRGRGPVEQLQFGWSDEPLDPRSGDGPRCTSLDVATEEVVPKEAVCL